MELEVSDLAVARGGVAVLSGLSFRVGPGQALVLRGPNGVGKTTVLRTVAGLQRPLRGRIAPGPDAIAYAGHADAVKPTLTVAENLTFWARVYGGGPIGPALADMALAGLAHRPGMSLSAGQKRRLGLARLLLTRRPVWLLDEPTVSLDADTVALFAALLTRHLGQGGIALMATHIDLGLPEARALDLSPYRAAASARTAAGFDEVFL